MPLDGTTYDDDMILREIRVAKQTLIEKGWCKNVLMDNKGRVCFLGAFSTYRKWDLDSTTAWMYTVEAAGFVSPALAIMWNNAPRTTKEQVLEVLDKAIEKRLQEIASLVM